MVSVNFHQYLQPSVTITQGHHLKFIQLQARVDVFLHSFLPSTIRSASQCGIITHHALIIILKTNFIIHIILCIEV